MPVASDDKEDDLSGSHGYHDKWEGIIAWKTEAFIMRYIDYMEGKDYEKERSK